MKREISAGIIIYRRTKEGPNFLLLYHGRDYWNFPKGKLDREERSFRAALREVREETGLSGRDLKFDDYFRITDRYAFNRGKEKVFKIVIYYLAETRQNQIRVSREHEGYGWFLYKDAVKMLKYQNLKNNLRKAHDVIQGKSFTGRPQNPPRQNA